MTKTSLIDKERLLQEFAGDEEILADVWTVFKAELPKMLTAIELAIQSEEMNALERSAHTLKGAVANFHAPVVKDAAFGLERIGREKNGKDASDQFQKLKELLFDFQLELDDLIQRRSRGK